MSEKNVITAHLEHVEATLSVLQEQVQALRARGTGDRREAAEAASRPVARVEPPKGPSLRERIAVALSARSLDLRGLAREVGETGAKIATELRQLRKDDRIRNVGSDVEPIWTWRLGDECSAAELNAAVARLVRERPMTTRELADATGARMSRVGGAVVALQRSGVRVIDMGRGQAGRWFVLPDDARDARLAPKK